MIRKLLTPIAFLLLFSMSIQAQEIDSRKHINKAHKAYTEQLQLSEAQSKEFKVVLNKFNPILKMLIHQKSDNKEFNKQLKLMDLEVYKILNQNQFSDYKRVKLELESFKKYRFDS